MSNNVKVVGYAQRVFYNDGIEYRNFSSGLVGNQQTQGSNGNSNALTLGNFVTTTNYQGKSIRIYSVKQFSDFYTLDNYGATAEVTKSLIKNNINVSLNLDKTDLCNFAYFGSSTEFVRVSLENIITNWPASIYLNPLRDDGFNTIVGDTVSDYSYDPVLNRATFDIDVNFIANNFNINYLKNGTIIDTFNQDNKLRNLTVNYPDYVVAINGNEYKLLSFTGATSIANDIIKIGVEGDPFGFNGTGASRPEYHIKPNKTLEETFFNSLNEYEDNLLNRLTTPRYTSNYKYKVEMDDGTIISSEKKLTWPTTDGYNIDYDTINYSLFVSELLKITKNKDITETNLIARFLTAESISNYDTVPKCDGSEEETAGQKMNKVLKIYGREFDEIKKHIDGISFANVVTYDKKENTPDQLVKYLARVLGWELTSSIIENDLINTYLNVGARSYAGQSRGLTPAESEIELWRRLILNSSWIWKSKGTRKGIEFFFKLIGAPDGLIEFDEHVYVAKAPIDMDLFFAVLDNNNRNYDLSDYNVDEDGYPKFFRDTSDMYFQKGGQWYRQTAGSGATQYILAGNNPHVGPYDNGKEYINQLENIIPGFTPFTLTSTTITTGTTQLFTNYNNGIVNQYTGSTNLVGLQNDDGVNLSTTILLDADIIKDPCPQIEQTDCGCDIPEDDEALKIDIVKGAGVTVLTSLKKAQNCNVDVIGQSADTVNHPIDGGNFYNVEFQLYKPDKTLSTNTKITKWVNPNCCNAVIPGTISYYYEEYQNSDITSGSTFDWTLVNCGHICANTGTTDLGKSGVGSTLGCQWVLAGPGLGSTEIIGSDYYLKFKDPKGDFRIVNADTGFCPVGYFTSTYLTDPYTGKPGYGCKLNAAGINSLANNPTETNAIYQLYNQRAKKIIGCNIDTPI